MKALWRTRLSRRMRKNKGIRATARVFIPSIGKRLIVIPFKTISIIPLILLLVASVYLFLRSDILLVKQVEIVYEGGIPQDEEYAEGFVKKEILDEFVTSQTIARSIFSLNTSEIESAIKNMDSIIESVRVQRKLPDKILVSVEEREIVAVLVLDRQAEDGATTNEYYLIDGDGVLFRDIPRPPAVPQFRYQAWIESTTDAQNLIGNRLPEEVLSHVLRTIKHVGDQHAFVAIAYTMVDDFTMHIQTQENTILVITFDKPIETQVRQISVILDQLKSGDKKARRIDARFDKIFVEYQ